MKFKKIILGTILSAFLLQGCSAVMALSGGDNPDFKVIAKGKLLEFFNLKIQV